MSTLRRTLLALAAVFTVFAAALSAGAVPGNLDALNGEVAGDYVLATAVQPDGKTILVGGFSSVLGGRGVKLALGFARLVGQGEHCPDRRIELWSPGELLPRLTMTVPLWFTTKSPTGGSSRSLEELKPVWHLLRSFADRQPDGRNLVSRRLHNSHRLSRPPEDRYLAGCVLPVELGQTWESMRWVVPKC